MKTEADFGRSPIQVVEIWQPMCVNTYGSSPCTGAVGTTGLYKCYNTRKTCQDPTNYSTGGSPENFLKLRFGKAGVKQVADEYIIPSLQSVSTAPSIINPSGGEKNSGVLGHRAVCNVVLQDHPHSDLLVDPYRTTRASDPYTQSTFWAKWLVRNPYYPGYRIRVYDGYEGQTLAQMTSRDYLIERIDGPSNGQVRIVAKDPLKFADNDRATVPVASTGLLYAGITIAATSLQIYDASVSDYASSGTVRVADECITYSGMSYNTGTDIITLTGLTRGSDNTVADAQEADETVQACVRITGQDSWSVVNDFLQNYAGVPASFIPFTDWDTLCTTYIPSFQVSTLLTEPVGVYDLISELCQQCLFYIFWDERVAQIKLRCIRTYSSPDYTINERNILEDSLAVRQSPDDRISQVWIYYGRKNPTVALDERGNYTTRRVRIVSHNYGSERIKKIYSRWLTTDAQAINLGARTLTQYKDIPKFIKMRLDAKDRAIWTADIVDLNTSQVINAEGESVYQRYQIISAEEIIPGEVVEYNLMDMQFYGRAAVYMDGTASPAPTTYALSSEAVRAAGGFYADADGLMSDGTSGYTYQ